MKKLIALILALVLAFGLVACTANETTTEGSSDEADLATVHDIYGDPQWKGELPLVSKDEDVTITIGICTNANVLDYETNDYTKWVEEQTGVNLDFVQFSGTSKDAATQISLMIAGGEKLPDVLYGFTGISKAIAKEYGRDGYFIDISSYLNTDAHYMAEGLKRHYDDEYELIKNQVLATIIDPVSNKIYNYPSVVQNPNDNLLAQMWINQVWLDNLGLEKPTNIHELYDVLVAFRDGDPNGNGLKDEIPMVGRDGNIVHDLVGWIINAFIYYVPTYKFNVENGVVYSPYDQPEYREALIYIKKLVDEGLLSNLTWTMSYTELESLLNPTGDFTVGVLTGAADERFEVDHQSMYDYVPLAPLADETGKGGYGAIRKDNLFYNTFITTDCENPQIAFRMLDLMCSEEGYLRQRWGVRGEDWDYVKNSDVGGQLGGEAKIEVYSMDAYTSVNNKCWHALQSICSEEYWQYALDTNDGSWKATQYKKLQEQIANYEAAGIPDDVIYQQARNDAEEEIFQEHNSDLNSFTAKARANFCTGVTDPNKDSDWNQYITDLYEMGYQESWIDVAQACYDRSK